MTDGRALKEFTKYGLDWDKVLGAPSFLLRNASRGRLVWVTFRGLVAMICRRPPDVSKFSCDVLFFKSIQRSDYQPFFDNVVASCRLSKGCLDLKYAYGLSRVQLSVFLAERKSLRILRRAVGGDLIAALYLYCNLVRCITLLRILEGSEFRALVVFGDVYLLDNFLVQYSRRRGIKTATLQHGLYIDTSANRQNINFINYQNIVSDDFLAWGENTARLVNRYAPTTRTLVVGKPVEFGLRPGPEAQQVKRGVRYFVVILDSQAFQKHNARLLTIGHEVARRLELKMAVRFHPDNDRSTYTIDPAITVEAGVADAQFGMGHITTYLYEMMRSGKQVYKLRSEEPTHQLPDQLCFSSADELLSKIGEPFNFAETAHQFVKYVSEEAAGQYRGFFATLEHSPKRTL